MSRRRDFSIEAGLVEKGTHDELMTQHGKYAELFTLQAAAYQVGGAPPQETPAC